MADLDLLTRFRAFLAAAESLSEGDLADDGDLVGSESRATTPALTEAEADVSALFLAFVTRARWLLASSGAEPSREAERSLAVVVPGLVVPDPLVARFTAFIEQGRPLAVADARQTLATLAVLGPKVTPWVMETDVLGLAGVGLLEVPFTRLLAWALSPPGHPAVALACQNALLSRFGLGGLTEPLEVEEQVVTLDGIPDLVLRGEQHLVVIEAKTGTGEHAAPSGVEQTIAYHQQLLVPATQRVRELIFLTLDGDRAAHEEAVCCTWLDVALSLIEGLSAVGSLGGLQATYATLLTHWLQVATPRRLGVLSLLHRAPELVNASDLEVLGEIEAIREVGRVTTNARTP